ncbi:hypothetical protein ES705_27941 [subsurface metagenome]
MLAKSREEKVKSRKLQKGDLPFIKRVYKLGIPATNKKGEVKEYWYWYGSYSKDGVTYMLYIGKVLPEQLRRLLVGRVWNPKSKTYYWPDSRHDQDKLDNLRIQEARQGHFRLERYYDKEV